MDIHHAATEPTDRAPEASFVGDVQIGGYFERSSPSRLSGATVPFAPGSRTPWKANPAGQTIVVTSGVGWAQTEGEEVVELRTGDTVWFAPGERHWEGATPDATMTYVAVQEGGVRFLGPVSDDEYRTGPPAAPGS